MRYTSTRDGSISASFEEAICSGYAPDGGLFVPEQLPKIDVESHLKPWSLLSYPDLARSILRLFISTGEVSDEDLDSICTSAFYGFENPKEAVPVVRIGSLYVAELWHGPTFCFKDLGMRAVVNLLSHFSTLRNRNTTLLVSTTGDTGPAAVQAVSDVANPLLTILVHYPKGQISDFQRKQLTTVASPCVRVAAFEGGGDDMDAPIKHILTSQSTDKNSRKLITGVNSYNIGRPLMQMVHYVWTYLRVVEKLGVTPGDVTLDIVLPCGAMGNIAGGYMAKRMGVPLGKLCSGVNINDITHRVMQTGQFHKSPSMEKTLSEAINVQLPYNFERLLFYLADGNHALVNEWMATVDKTTKLDLDQTWLERLQTEFSSERVTDNKMCETIRRVRDSYGYYCDPHTAVAFSAAEMLGYRMSAEQQKPLVAVLSTASPCKFEEAVTVAIGKDGWASYRKDHFPEPANLILRKDEIPPTIYAWRKGANLSDTQKEWESIAQEIIEELGSNPAANGKNV